MTILVEVEGQHLGLDQVLLKLPGSVVDSPRDPAVPSHPGGELGLAFSTEGHSFATTDPPQADTQLIGQKTSEGKAQG